MASEINIKSISMIIDETKDVLVARDFLDGELPVTSEEDGGKCEIGGVGGVKQKGGRERRKRKGNGLRQFRQP